MYSGTQVGEKAHTSNNLYNETNHLTSSLAVGRSEVLKPNFLSPLRKSSSKNHSTSYMEENLKTKV